MKLLWILSGLYTWFSHFIGYKFKIPFTAKCRFFFKGYYQSAYYLFDFDKYGKDAYFPERRKFTKSVFIDIDYARILQDKLVFAGMIDSHVDTPAIYAYLHKGRVMELRGSGMNDVASLIAKIKELNGTKLIFKPRRMSGGRGVFAVSFTEKDGFLYNMDAIPEEKLAGILSSLKDSLAVQYIAQGAFNDKIFDKTTNTARMITMVDPQTNKAFLASVLQKFGRVHTVPADNASKGGVLVAIDVKTGKPLRCVERAPTEYVDIEAHPDSGASLKDYAIPNWDKVVENVLDLANTFNYIPLVGWDVVIRDDGSIGVIEGNANPDMYMVQIAEPLLIEPKIRQFFEYYGVIKQRP